MIRNLLIPVTCILVLSCNQGPEKKETVPQTGSEEYAESRIVVKAESQWEEMLRRNDGWIGADGIYAVAMNGIEKPGMAGDSETLFWFSDNIWGTIGGDTLADDWQMAHNCVGYFRGDDPEKTGMEFFRRTDSAGNTLSMFEPHTPSSNEGDYYWLGDGFFSHALDSTIYIFAYRIKNIPGGIYPFDDVGLSLIALPKGSRPPYPNQRQLDVPFFHKDSKGKGKVVFGISVLANTRGAGAPKPDGFIYVYGVRGPQKELLVARVEESLFEKFDQWRFWNGAEWVNDIHSAAALTNNISNEMSVSFMEDGRVLAVYQYKTNSPDIMIQAGQTPAGPFQPAKKVWSTPEIYEDLDFYTYNAKAHPHLSRPGEVLISYNVNSFDFLDDIKYHPHHLRPRFFSVRY